MEKTKRINTSELPGMIQERLELHYHQYEIKDVLNGLMQVIRDSIQAGCEIKLKGIGTFKPKEGAERNFKSGLTGYEFTKRTNNGVIFTPDRGFIEELNKEVVDN